MSLIGDNETRDKILSVLTEAKQIVDMLAKVGEAAFPAEALAIAGADLLLDQAFELAIKLTGNTKTLEDIKAAYRADTLAAIRSEPTPPKP